MGSGSGAVLVVTPAGHQKRQEICRKSAGHQIRMAAGRFLVVALLVASSVAERRLRGNQRGNAEPRDERSLAGTFPFNANNGQVHDGAHHGTHHEEPARRAFSDLTARDQRQRGGDDADVSFPAVAAARAGNDGKRCIDKVEMIEETEYDEVVQCDHSYDRRCHTTYVTNYESQQEEDCDENFRKSCFIEYEQIAFNETAEVCRTPLVKDCDVQGPEICRTEYESECWTKQEVHDVQDDVVECETQIEEKCEDNTSGYTTNTKCSKWPREVCSVSKKPVKKYTPITGCTKEPGELCAPAGCGFKEGREECFEKVQTVVQDVPKEECTRSRTNPRKVKKPVVKKWCYVPTEES